MAVKSYIDHLNCGSAAICCLLITCSRKLVHTQCMTHILHLASLRLCCSVGFVTESQQKSHGWVEDNRGHLLSVCFIWCPATKLCCQNTQGYPCARSCVWGPAHWSTFIAYWLRWEKPVSCQSPDTIEAVFERGLVVAGSLHNHAINLNWRSLVEHRKTFKAPRQ